MSQAQPPEGEIPRDPADDATLGGYLDKHDRPPAFQGSDGHPYTVSLEVERTGDLREPYAGYLDAWWPDMSMPGTYYFDRPMRAIADPAGLRVCEDADWQTMQ